MHAKKMWSIRTVCCVCGYQQLLVNMVYELRLVLHEILTKIAEHMKHFMIQKLKFQVVMKYFTLCSTSLLCYIRAKLTAPQDAHGRLVLQVYLGPNTLQFSATHR